MNRQSCDFILASSSPQRIRLVEQMGIRAQVQPVDMDEDHSLGESAEELVRILAKDKLSAWLTQYPDRRDAVVLAADTIVALDNARLGKPTSVSQAANFLRLLSGKCHQVLTATAVYVPPELQPDVSAMASDFPQGFEQADVSGISAAVQVARTDIELIDLSQNEIDAYISWDEWQGAAGGYRIQGRAGCFMRHMSGSFTNVVGLPIEVLYAILRRTSFWKSA